MALTLACCGPDISGYEGTGEMETRRHDGLCFVIYHPWMRDSPQMVEVDCSKLESVGDAGVDADAAIRATLPTTKDRQP